MGFIIGTLLSAIAFVISSKLMSSVDIKGFTTAILVALIMALLNNTVGEVLNFFSAPINWITLGLFSFVVQAFLLRLASRFLSGFYIKDFWAAFKLAFVVAIVNWGIRGLVGDF